MRAHRTGTISTASVIKALVMFCLLGTALSFVTTQQQIAQAASVVLLAAAAAFALVMRRIRPDSLSAYELIMMFYALSSAFISSLFGYYNASTYSFILFLCVISAGAVVRSLSLRDLFDVFVRVSVLLVMIPLGLYMPQLVTALSLSVNDFGLERFTPFGMHPNLVGFIYAGTAIILAGRFTLAQKRFAKLFFLLMAALSLLFVVAASARSAMLGVLVAGGFYAWTVAFARGGNKKRRITLLMTAAVVGLIALSVAPLRGYLTSAFEVTSDTRGVNSGGSGRFEIWQAGVDLLLSQPIRMLIGFGFRSSDPDIIGFPVESSYINLSLEVGLVGAAILIGLYLLSALKMVLIGKSRRYGDEGTIYLFFGLAILAFMVHSIFNRYLIGIGNPMSLIALLMMMSFSVQFSARRKTGADGVAATHH